jgi:hypothetical protein
VNFDNAEIKSRLTPVNDDYESCERTFAELRVDTGTMHPSVVSDLLDIKPTSQVILGESGPINSVGRSRIGKINGWFLSSEGNVKSRDTRRHLDWLIAKLQQSSRALRKLQTNPGIRMCVNCIWWSRFGDGGPTLWPEQMRVLADLNLECSFAFADYSDTNDVKVET